MKKLLLYIAGLLPLFLTSCEEDITLDVPPYEPKLAVYCVLYADSLPTLFLNQSKAYFDYTEAGQETEYIDKAQVLIEDMDTHEVDTLKPDIGVVNFPNQSSERMHYYLGHTRSKARGRYKLTVNYGGKTVTGETKVPTRIYLAKNDITYTADSTEFGDSVYHFKIKVHDPADEENSYELHVSGRQGGFYFGPSFINDGSSNGKDIVLEYDYYSYPDPWGNDTLSLTFQVDDYTRSTADYIESVYNQQNNDGNPFVEPAIIKHNVTGGLGVFGAATYGNGGTIKIR